MINIINDVRLVGRIVDKEIKVQTLGNSNVQMAYFKIANSKRYFNSSTNKWEEKTQFIPLKVFGKMAESIASKFAQGDLVMVSCEIDVKSTKDNDGEWNTYWSLLVQNIIKLGKSSKNQDLSKTQETEIKNLNNDNDKRNEELAKSLFADNNQENDNNQPWELDF